MSSMKNHIDRLQQKHDNLETELHIEESRPGGGDEINIKRIKLEKLSLKEEITRLTESGGEIIHHT